MQESVERQWKQSNRSKNKKDQEHDIDLLGHNICRSDSKNKQNKNPLLSQGKARAKLDSSKWIQFHSQYTKKT